ncbi:MAG: hypothetical protein JJU20_01495 [Opitutales bacterium]|nr:hypothetical protein [Opitutales bacterium]
MTAKLWILLLIFSSGQILMGNLPTRILEADWTAVHVHGDAVLVADSDGNLLRSTDGGIVFESRYQGTPEDAIHFIYGSGSTAIAVGAGGWILRSADNGQSWSEVAADAILGQLSAVVGNGSGHWVAAGQHQGSAATQVSTDDGLTWTLHSVSGVYELTGITWHSGSNQFVASGSDGFFSGSVHASPEGSSWSSINVPSETSVLKFIASDGSNGLLAGGREGILLRSEGSPISFSAVEGFRPSEHLRSAVSTGQGSWIIGGDQAILIEIPAASGNARLRSNPLPTAGSIVSIANRGGEEILLAGSFSDYPWGPPQLQAEFNGQQLILRLHNARLGRSYQLQSSTNLSQWSNLSGTTRQATQRTLEWTVAPDETNRFFRVLVD